MKMDSKRAYFYGRVGERPLFLVNVPLVEGSLLLDLKERFPPVVTWRGIVFYWQASLGGYRQWTTLGDLAQITDADFVIQG